MLTAVKTWIKKREHPIAKMVYAAARGGAVPCIPVVHKALYGTHKAITHLWADLIRRFYTTPLFCSQLQAPAKQLYLYGGMPYMAGNLEVTVGKGCRISGQTTFTGRPASGQTALIIGDNCDVGWQTTIAVGTKVQLGDNVRIAGRAFLAGYPGHPLDAQDRAAGLPDTDDQTGDIILEDDVWLGTGVTVLAGVSIGKGSIIGAGSVVTHNIPAGVMAAGVPARVIKELPHG